MNHSLISIIMSVYNENPSWLKEAIESILMQTHKNIEFIIIMDNPENLELINIIEKYKTSNNKIKLFINKQNMGLIYSLNRALKNCTGSFIARMDADDISNINRLEKQLNYLIDNNLDLIGSNVNLFKNDKEIFYTTNKLLTHKYLKRMLKQGTIGIVHPTFFAKKEVFESLNGYSNSPHTEDKEFLARVFCSTFKVGNIEEVLLDCRYNKDSITKTNAIYVNKIGIYVTKVFKKCLSSGQYKFDEKYHDKLKIFQKEKDYFNKKQILMGESRKNLNEKKYSSFLINIIKATYYSSSAFSSIRINLVLKIFKFMENIELKGIK